MILLAGLIPLAARAATTPAVVVDELAAQGRKQVKQGAGSCVRNRVRCENCPPLQKGHASMPAQPPAGFKQNGQHGTFTISKHARAGRMPWRSLKVVESKYR